MTIIMWIVIAVLWTILVFLAGWACCKVNFDQEIEKKPLTNQYGYDGTEGPQGPPGIQGEPGEPGKPCPVSPDEIDAIKGRLTDLENRDVSYQSRFTRVERKAGLSV